jgi:transcription elongation factor Elf1
MSFNQLAYPTAYFSEKIFAVCPECGGKGVINTILGKYTIHRPYGNKSVFTCTKCSCQIENSDSQWSGYYQGIVKQACGHCNASIFFAGKPVKEPHEFETIKCEECGYNQEYSPKWFRYNGDKPVDPFLGLDLWLQVEVKGNILWVYNLKHLDYLKSYVEAKIRNDDNRHKYSMITNLPQWIKASKNRDLILKKLEVLRKKAGVF